MLDHVESSSQSRKLLLGPPGCGKTHRLIEEVRKELQKGTSPDRIIVVSFTRKAIEEMVTRACAAFDLTAKDLPYFRTLHSLGMSLLGMRGSDVMTQAEWKDFGKGLGIDIVGTSDRSSQDGLIVAPSIGGDKYVNLIERAIMRCIPLEKEFAEASDWTLSWPMMRKVEEELALYKSIHNKISFVDMINQFVCTMNQGPRAELLIVDEAQDLTPLQWRMVDILAQNAKRVLIAGDDDQCIHRWAGVDVKLFMQCSKNTEVLSQSYRLSAPVHALSVGISGRIRDRLPKEFFPAEHEGSVSRVLGPWNLDLREGKWMILARTNSYVQDWAKKLRADGYMFQVYGRNSVSPELGAAVQSWRALQKGDGLSVAQIKKMYELIPKMGDAAGVRRASGKLIEALSADQMYGYDALVTQAGLIAPRDTDALRVFNLGDDETAYIRAIERRGEDINSVPRLKLSTIHQSKGGEEDNVALDLSSTKACCYSDFPDDEHRNFYVGASRARYNLHLIHTDKAYRYVV